MASQRDLDPRRFDIPRHQRDPMLDRVPRPPSLPSAIRGASLARTSSQATAAIPLRQDFLAGRESLSMPEFDAAALHGQRDLVLLDTLPVLDQERESFEFPASATVRRAAESHRRVFEQISKLADVLGHAGTFITGPWEAVPAAEKLKETKAEIDMRTELERALHKDNRAQTVDRLIGSTD
jgi:hypothetical protein